MLKLYYNNKFCNEKKWFFCALTFYCLDVLLPWRFICLEVLMPWRFKGDVLRLDVLRLDVLRLDVFYVDRKGGWRVFSLAIIKAMLLRFRWKVKPCVLASSLYRLGGKRLSLVRHGFQFSAGLQEGRAQSTHFLCGFVLLWWSLKPRAG